MKYLTKPHAEGKVILAHSSRMQSVVFQSSKRPIAHCMCNQEAEEDECLHLAVSPIYALTV